ncbi:hypothetical protein C0075_02670 [Rhizobium sp. KAs_5_22]|nr:hypothetical protein C0075_02670 [Rhizobium sp. KAs_5_22]
MRKGRRQTRVEIDRISICLALGHAHSEVFRLKGCAGWIVTATRAEPQMTGSRPFLPCGHSGVSGTRARLLRVWRGQVLRHTYNERDREVLRAPESAIVLLQAVVISLETEDGVRQARLARVLRAASSLRGLCQRQ